MPNLEGHIEGEGVDEIDIESKIEDEIKGEIEGEMSVMSLFPEPFDAQWLRALPRWAMTPACHACDTVGTP